MMTVYILAGNYRQFVQKYGQEQRRSDAPYRYISSRESIMGLHHLKVERIGTYYERPDLDEIELEIKMRNL